MADNVTGQTMPRPDDVREAASRLSGAVAAHLPRDLPGGGPPWDFYGPAMVSRMVDTVQSAMLLMGDDRAVDGGALVRVLYEHVVKFCWISIAPDINYASWQSDSDGWDAKLHNDAISVGVFDGERSDTRGYASLNVAQLAQEVDQFWPAKITAFTSPDSGPAQVTMRGLYLLAYRNASEAVHGRPNVLRGYGSVGSGMWNMGSGAGAKSLLLPLTVPLFAQACLVCHHQWGWPDADEIVAANNAMYAGPQTQTQ